MNPPSTSPPKKLAGVYLVWGGDDYIVERTVSKVLGEIARGAGGDLAVESLDCEETELEGVIEELMTPSLFSVNRVTLLRHFKLTADSKLAREVERCLAMGLAPGQSLVIAAAKVDKRLKLAKLIEDQGNAIELAPFDDAGMRAWIGERFKEEGKSASSGVAEVLRDLRGDDLRSLDAEIDKIVTYVGQAATITEDDLYAVVGRSRTEKIFELLSQVMSKRAADALATIADLLDAGETGTRIVGYLGREIRWLAEVKLFMRAEPGLWDAGMTPNEFTREVLPRIKAWAGANKISDSDAFLRRKPYAVYCRFKEAQGCDLAGLVRMLEGLVEANRLIVSTSMQDKIALESFVAGLAAQPMRRAQVR
jgi:DNA polymerase III subunit delta